MNRLILIAAVAAALPAQTPPLDLQAAVTRALSQYPSIRVSEAQTRIAAAAIQLARTAYLPKLEGVAGVNRATRNNVLGLLLPSQILAPISGPVLNTNGLANTWGSTIGLLVTWEPFDFGLRAAEIAAAETGSQRAGAALARTELELASLTADAFLTVVAAEQTVAAAQAAVQRAAELERITRALVDAELRPGAESSLAKAERASAQAQLIRARQAVAESKAALAALLGIEPNGLAVRSGPLLTTPGDISLPSDIAANPAALEAQAAIRESEARLRILDRSYFPKFSLQGTSYARGTGALPDGRLLGGVNGLGPNIQNWGIGFTATFSVFDLPAIRARRTAEEGRRESERARHSEILAQLKSRRDAAQAALQAARDIAATTPVAVEAAGTAVQQARARYESGLGTALEVADAQRRLTQAEIDDSLARLNIWRAKLAIHAAQGDLTPLLLEAGR